MIFIPDNLVSTDSMCKVAAKGDGVSHFIRVNDVAMVSIHSGDRQNLTFANGFFCGEENIFAVIRNGLIYPLGNRVLIRRDIADEYTDGGILIPENRRYQSLFGTIIRWGLSRKEPKIPVGPGDRIRLTEWGAHMVEVRLPDGDYGLIVNEDDLLYQEINE